MLGFRKKTDFLREKIETPAWDHILLTRMLRFSTVDIKTVKSSVSSHLFVKKSVLGHLVAKKSDLIHN